jgi:carboxymethylenebutenolidase
MTEMQRYLAEEVAEDLADGIITRREALQRLGLMGIGRISRKDSYWKIID